MAPAAIPSGLQALHDCSIPGMASASSEHGLARQDRDLELIRYGNWWGAAIYWTGHLHPTAQATGWQMTPWAAVQQAAFRALHKSHDDETASDIAPLPAPPSPWSGHDERPRRVAPRHRPEDPRRHAPEAGLSKLAETHQRRCPSCQIEIVYAGRIIGAGAMVKVLHGPGALLHASPTPSAMAARLSSRGMATGRRGGAVAMTDDRAVWLTALTRELLRGDARDDQ